MRQQKREQREWRLFELDRERVRVKNELLQALLLGIVATRIRAVYGSVNEARIAWNTEAVKILSRLNLPKLENALCRPAAEHVAKSHILHTASESYAVVKLILDVGTCRF
jgi:hypothetical protein